MPVPYLRGPYEGPPLEQLQNEMFDYLRSLTHIHRAIFQQVKGATVDRRVEIPEDLQAMPPRRSKGQGDPYAWRPGRIGVGPRVTAVGRCQGGYHQRAPRRGAPPPQLLVMSLMSRHLTAAGMMMRAQGHQEQRKLRKLQKKKKKKAAAQKQILIRRAMRAATGQSVMLIQQQEKLPEKGELWELDEPWIGAEHGQQLEIPVSKAAEYKVGLPRAPSHARAPRPPQPISQADQPTPIPICAPRRSPIEAHWYQYALMTSPGTYVPPLMQQPLTNIPNWTPINPFNPADNTHLCHKDHCRKPPESCCNANITCGLRWWKDISTSCKTRRPPLRDTSSSGMTCTPNSMMFLQNSTID
ncbi:uncharacterized protein LOC117245648 [Epinephelus lanceolatus]|uniref:uncharacterized protein LOC117245648 n=1 Tax=Epinephelus lanceolatus TaxID=310571 RepID=UPI001446574B|nr:uncharacterized protein LOC117245648 [Epinephelus lanceolatus]